MTHDSGSWYFAKGSAIARENLQAEFALCKKLFELELPWVCALICKVVPQAVCTLLELRESGWCLLHRVE